MAEALSREGIRAVLTGGACATIYSRGVYKSSDLDAAMQSIGFHREGDHYRHPVAPFFVG